MRRKDLMLVIATLFFCFFVILRTSGPKSLPKLGKHPYMPPVVDHQPAGPAVPSEPERPYEPVDVEQPPYKPPLSDPPVNVLRPQARQVAEMGEKEAFDPFSLVAAKGIDAVPIGTNNAWNQDPAPGKTTYKCYRSVDWAEVCVYTNICHDGNFVVFFNDTKPAMSNITRYFRVGDDSVGHHTFDVFPRPALPNTGLPLNTRCKGYYRPQKDLLGQNPNVNIRWTSDALWVVEPEYRGYELQHPFFWAHSVFGMWEARFSNESWGGVVPSMDTLILPKQAKVDLNQWNLGTIAPILQPHTKIMMGGELAAAGLSPSNLLCSKRAVITGHKPSVFSGIASCHTYRAAVYNMLGLKGADRAKRERNPPHHLVIWDRKGRRGFINIEEILALVHNYGINYTLVETHGSFKQQVELMSKAGVFLIAHGAAATNTMFQPHRSVLIEVFPYMRKRFGFQNVASMCGNFYYPIFSWDKPPEDERMNSEFFKWKCDHKSSIDTNHEFECDQSQKESDIIVPINTLEQTLIDAFDTIGKRIYKGGSAPPRPTRPPYARPESGLVP